MWFAPGSHKVKRGLKRFVRNKTNSGTEFIKAEEDVNEPKDEEYVCKETKEGTLVNIILFTLHVSLLKQTGFNPWISVPQKRI